MDGTLSYSDFAEFADIVLFQRVTTYQELAAQQAIRKCANTPIAIDLDDNILDINKEHFLYRQLKPRDLTDIYESYYIPIEDVEKHKNINRRILAINACTDKKRAAVITLKKGITDAFRVAVDSVKDVNAIITTTNNLYNTYKVHNKHTYVVPNSIDFDIWDKLPLHKDNGDKVVIGFAGGTQHAPDLNSIADAMETILTKYPNVRFHTSRIVMHRDWQNPMDKVVAKFSNQCQYTERVEIDDYPKKFAEWNFDILIAPVLDNNFNRGKSNLKWLESGAFRIPLVCSDVECYGNVVDRVTGYKAKSTTEWVDSLSALVVSKKLRHEIGDNAYQAVKKDFDIKNNAVKWLDALKDIRNKYDSGENNKNKIEVTEQGRELAVA
jgi:glycosyltransferase involved in cell wall biosynthesis